MAAKRILFDDDARRALGRGIERVAHAVSVTLGPSGRTVILDRGGGSPAVTSDGVTVLREMELADPHENAGARLLREAADRTSEAAGDGATTTAVLVHALVREGLKAVAAGVNPLRLKRGIDRALAEAVHGLTAQAVPLEGSGAVRRLAERAAGRHAGLGATVSEALERVGARGVVRVDRSPSASTRLRFEEGLQFEGGYLSPYFVNSPETMEVVLEEPLLLLTGERVKALPPLLPFLQHAARERRPLLVLAAAVEGEALAGLVVNRLRGRLEACAVRLPESAERRHAFLEDLSLLTGAAVLGDEAGRTLEAASAAASAAAWGAARRAVVERARTTILGGAGDRERVEERVRDLERRYDKVRRRAERLLVEERLARLSGTIAVVEVGGHSEIEVEDRRARAEDAVAALRSALEEGVVPGGGLALLRVQAALERLAARESEGDVRAGVRLVARALEEPMRRIADNAGYNPSLVVREARAAAPSQVWNAETGRFEEFAVSGILDAVKTVRVALQNAVSTGILLLTAEAIAVEDEDAQAEGGNPA